MKERLSELPQTSEQVRVEKKDHEPSAEILGKMSELMTMKYNGGDRYGWKF